MDSLKRIISVEFLKSGGAKVEIYNVSLEELKATAIILMDEVESIERDKRNENVVNRYG